MSNSKDASDATIYRSNMALLKYLEAMTEYYFWLKDYGRFKYYQGAWMLSSDTDQGTSLDNKPRCLLKFLKETNKYEKILNDFSFREDSLFNYKSGKEEDLLTKNPWLKLTSLLYSGHSYIDIDFLKEESKNLETREEFQKKEEEIRESIDKFNLQIADLSYHHLKISPSDLSSEERDIKESNKPLGLFALNHTVNDIKNDFTNIYKELRAEQVKHLFVADQFESPNSSIGLNKERFIRRKKLLDKLEVENQIKTYQGVVLDINLEGKPIIDEDLLSSLDFVIISIKTKPNFKISERLNKAAKHLTKVKNKIILDLFSNGFSFLNELDEIDKLIRKENLIIAFAYYTNYTSTKALSILQSFDQSTLRIAFVGTRLAQLNPKRWKIDSERTILDNFKMSAFKIEYIYPRSKILNFKSNPFSLIQSENRIFIKEDSRLNPLTSNRTSNFTDNLKKMSRKLTFEE